ncbi:MAG: GAF domain-containing protein [Hymenobacteraceae bacterium]|nr:GAF domain-containing protein [Hymenobacteraceae bacterium]
MAQKDAAEPIDQQEEERLKALEAYNILDTPAETEYDEITQLASYICGTPISLISLITHDRQWFKSRVGLKVQETPRSMSFCQHAIKQEEFFEIPDALQDKRFKDNPLVTGDPNIRFYAGSQLIGSGGQKLGTLCVIDKVPKHLTDAQKKALQTLARQVVTNFELRLKQQELEQEKKQLQKANYKLDQFVHMVSHDLKEPIMNMHAVTEWLQEDLSAMDYSSLSSNLQLLKERASAMEDLVEGLLQYSSTQVKNLKKEVVAVGTLLRNVISGIKGVKPFNIHIAPQMPVLQTERVLLQQVFANLISNAVKYHHTGSGNIWVNVADEGQKYTFSVKDDGPGIAPQHHAKIFGLYERLLRDSNTPGSGIGLATVKRIVEDKGGRIWLESELGKGATFYFTWQK